jgi:hypothetical protein
VQSPRFRKGSSSHQAEIKVPELIARLFELNHVQQIVEMAAVRSDGGKWIDSFL